MHRSHLRLCGIGLVLALGYLVLAGGSAVGVGLLIAVLVCPLAMIVAMTVLMGNGTQQPTADRTDAPAEPVEAP
jgi:uncharacterized membrane protein YdfJ with MMPL/SSD domain